jgi:hypothetical protein
LSSCVELIQDTYLSSQEKVDNSRKTYSSSQEKVDNSRKTYSSSQETVDNSKNTMSYHKEQQMTRDFSYFPLYKKIVCYTQELH